MDRELKETMRFRDLRSQFNVPARLRFSNGPRRCCWCGRHFGQKLQPTREHLLPHADGGGGGANLAAACSPCNSARGTDTNWILYSSRTKALPVRQAAHLRRVQAWR